MSGTGWKQYREMAEANNVGYRVFQQRVYSGMSPIKAATLPTEPKTKRVDLSHLEGRVEKVEGPMSRIEALEQIDIQTFKHCDSCDVRIQMNKRNGSNSSRLEKICISECPVGQQIQNLSQYLTVGPRKSIKG